MKIPVSAATLLGAGLLVGAAAGFMAPRFQVPEAPKMKSLHEFKLTDIEGKEKALKDYKGKAVLVVNVASKCGLTKQYDGLQALYSKYKDKGLVILGIPANDFAGQEPGTNEEIKTFCTTNFNVTFPMFSKTTVVGEGMNPLYAWLIRKTDGKPIEWNFAKFLVGRDGEQVTRFGSRVTPDDPKLVAAIEAALKV